MTDTIAPTDHIGDAETVYMTHECTEGVGSSLGKAFKEVWAPKGWTQTTREAYEAHAAKLATEQEAFLASPDAIMVPDGEGQAQDIINGERTGEAPQPPTEPSLVDVSDAHPVDAPLPPELDGLVDLGTEPLPPELDGLVDLGTEDTSPDVAATYDEGGLD